MIKPDKLAAAIAQELTLYGQELVDEVDKLSEQAAKDLAKRTKATAPVGARGAYKKAITSGLVRRHSTGSTYAWYVKSPHSRLTHLLTHGHVTRDGGRTRANPFLEQATDEVLKQYQQAVEKVLKSGK